MQQKYAELHDNSSKITVKYMIQRYLNEVSKVERAPSTYRKNLREAENLILVFGHLDPRAVKPVHIGQYLERRTNRKTGERAAVTANREIALFSSVYNKAVSRWGYADHNPCHRVQKNSERPRERLVTTDELQIFYDVANPMLKSYIEFKLMTGMRQGDILNLRITDIVEDGVSYIPSKTRARAPQRRLFTWTPELREVVGELRARRPKNASSAYLFAPRTGCKYSGDGFRAIWQRTMRKALAGGLTERFTEHDLRAVVATDAEEMGRDSRQLTGHTTEQAHAVYLRSRRTIRIDPMPRKGLEKGLEKFGSGKKSVTYELLDFAKNTRK